MISRFLAGVVVFAGLAACSPDSQSPPEEVQTVSETAIELPEPRDGVVTDRFATLALSCIHREYPNKIGHVMNSDADVGTPRQLHPAFYGCFDWHSSVHGHWLLVRILNTDPDTPFREAVIQALSESFTQENIDAELAYFEAPDRASFERPYGQAWFLQLMSELREAEFPEAAVWVERMAPLEDFMEDHTLSWLDKLLYPVRIGTHNQTAFCLRLDAGLVRYR